MVKNILVRNGTGPLSYSVIMADSHSNKLAFDGNGMPDYSRSIEVPIKRQLYNLIEDSLEHDNEVHRLLGLQDTLVFDDFNESWKWFENWNLVQVLDNEKERLLESLGWVPNDDRTMWEIPKYYQPKSKKAKNKYDKFLTLEMSWNFLEHT